jgi:hypothetical protein
MSDCSSKSASKLGQDSKPQANKSLLRQGKRGQGAGAISPGILFNFQPPRFPIFQDEGGTAFVEPASPSSVASGESATCTEEGCHNAPVYTFKDGAPPQKCSQHATPGMVDALVKRCQQAGCSRQPSFGHADDRPRFCSQHRIAGMVDVRNRMCEQEGCSRQPSYGHEGTKRRFCHTHKQPGMVDVKSAMCRTVGCSRHALYSYEGTAPQFCSAHKLEGMKDVKKRRRCQHPGCIRRASYNLPDHKPPILCGVHKQEGMINVNNRRCESAEGCTRRPCFALPGERPRFCALHKTSVMLDSRKTAAAAKSRMNVAAAAARGSASGLPGLRLRPPLSQKRRTTIHPPFPASSVQVPSASMSAGVTSASLGIMGGGSQGFSPMEVAAADSLVSLDFSDSRAWDGRQGAATTAAAAVAAAAAVTGVGGGMPHSSLPQRPPADPTARGHMHVRASNLMVAAAVAAASTDPVPVKVEQTGGELQDFNPADAFGPMEGFGVPGFGGDAELDDDVGNAEIGMGGGLRSLEDHQHQHQQQQDFWGGQPSSHHGGGLLSSRPLIPLSISDPPGAAASVFFSQPDLFWDPVEDPSLTPVIPRSHSAPRRVNEASGEPLQQQRSNPIRRTVSAPSVKEQMMCEDQQRLLQYLAQQQDLRQEEDQQQQQQQLSPHVHHQHLRAHSVQLPLQSEELSEKRQPNAEGGWHFLGGPHSTTS